MAFNLTLRPTDLNDFAREVHARNKRWWRDPATGEPIKRNESEQRMLMICEMAEGTEGSRKDVMDDDLPHRSSLEVELADCLIRLLDYAGGRNVPVSDPQEHYTDVIPQVRAFPVGEHLYNICTHICGHSSPEKMVFYVLGSIEMTCIILDLDLWGAVLEKLDFNDVRPDFTDEARLAVGGKKW